MPTMTAVRAAEAGAQLAVVTAQKPAPARGQVLIAVEACGICHSDAGMVEGHFPGVSYPCQPGHEIAGRIEALGEDVDSWAVGDRVAVGWAGGYCSQCEACRAGDMVNCAKLQVPGWAQPGGYAEFVAVPVSGLARIPEGMEATQAASMGCAGVTVYNGLRRTKALPGDLVAVIGLGGLGHLGVQFAKAMGFRVVGIARGAEKAELAAELGAEHYIDSTSQDVPAELQKLGGAKVVLATAANGEAMVAGLNGLSRRGELVIIGATPEPMPVSALSLIMGTKTITGHASGTAAEVEETMAFAQQAGVKVWVEEAPLTEGPAAYAEMMAGTPRFRKVLVTGK